MGTRWDEKMPGQSRPMHSLRGTSKRKRANSEIYA